MASKIDIASNALILIGSSSIQSFDEAGSGATAAANLYDNIYCTMLAQHPWSFALRQQELNRLTLTPHADSGYKYAYQKPTDLIRFWQMRPQHRYEIIRDYVYSNETKILATYVFKPDEGDLPPHFVDALQYRLAADFSMIVTEDENKSTVMHEKYVRALTAAMTIDSQGRPQTPMQGNPFEAGYER